MTIILSRRAEKQFKRLPEYIRARFADWMDLVEEIGLMRARTYKGYHDEPLKGDRIGQRSVRLSKSYRIIYEEVSGFIRVLEVNKHVY